jgi:hypothetical protein
MQLLCQWYMAKCITIGLVGDRDQVRPGSASIDIQVQSSASPLPFHRDDQLENDTKTQNKP